jgi:hypothetical protein
MRAFESIQPVLDVLTEFVRQAGRPESFSEESRRHRRQPDHGPAELEIFVPPGDELRDDEVMWLQAETAYPVGRRSASIDRVSSHRRERAERRGSLGFR